MKKLSVVNLSSKPPNPPIFFIDRSLGRKAISSALIEAGAEVIVHDEHFPQNTIDETWLEEAGKNGWIVLSKDKRIRYRANEKNALVGAKVLAFILIATNTTGEEMADIFVRSLKRMVQISNEVKRPAIYTIGRDAKPKKI